MSYELDGVWCTPATPDEICLIVNSSQATGLPNARYTWETPGCRENGTLTGGLEFDPDTASRLCLAPGYSLYSAAAQWAASGLQMTMIDGNPGLSLDLNYVPAD